VAKERVSALAKQVGKTSKELIEWLNSNGEYVKTPSSTIEAPVVAKVLAAFPKVEATADGADGAAAPKAKKTAAKKTAAPAPAPPTEPEAPVAPTPSVLDTPIEQVFPKVEPTPVREDDDEAPAAAAATAPAVPR